MSVVKIILRLAWILIVNPLLLFGFIVGFLFVYIGLKQLIECNFKCW